MSKHLVIALIAATGFVGIGTLNGYHIPSAAIAATEASEKTVTLAVQNMYCASCPHIVKASLEAVPGVSKVSVSFESKTASVTYDPTKATIAALITATTDAGYPSAPQK